MTRETFHRAMLAEVLGTAAEEQGIAKIQALREAGRIRDVLDEMQQTPDEDLTELSREEFLRRLEEQVASWPEECFRLVFDVYERLRRVRVLVQADAGEGLRLVEVQAEGGGDDR
jgi:hypothetical protein